MIIIIISEAIIIAMRMIRNQKFDFKKIFENRKLPIVETDNKTPEEVADEVIEIVKNLSI